MVAIARAIIEPRRLILVDEPTKGLAPAIIDHLAEAFVQLKASATTILLVEQNFGFVARLGDSVAVMDGGVIVHSGRMADLAADQDLQTRLLGLCSQRINREEHDDGYASCRDSGRDDVAA
jgi:branched-chain amino acid transport system ATP-binding protein